jgi:hypothetical protein
MCKNVYIREDDLVSQLQEFIDVVDIDEIGARHLIEREVTRFNKLRNAMDNPTGKLKATEMDIRRYAKYLLQEGSRDEKRELLEHLQGKLAIKDKKISLL